MHVMRCSTLPSTASRAKIFFTYGCVVCRSTPWLARHRIARRISTVTHRPWRGSGWRELTSLAPDSVLDLLTPHVKQKRLEARLLAWPGDRGSFAVVSASCMFRRFERTLSGLLDWPTPRGHYTGHHVFVTVRHRRFVHGTLFRET